MAVKFFEELSNDYLEVLDDKEEFNTIINVGKSPNSKTFRAHSVVLKHRSSYFRNELEKLSNDKNNIKAINLNNVSIQQFEIIIKYLYGGVVSLEKYDASFIFELMLIACELLLEKLTKYLETHLVEKEAHWLRLHFTRIYRKSFQSDKLQKLQKWCNDILSKYPDKVFDSEDFLSIQESALISVISRDDLQMDEVKIWNRVIEWGIAQNPGLPSDPKDWSIENFLTLKTTLKNCLPHIRYFQMSNEDIISNVKPYQQILDKNLWTDIMENFIASNQLISSKIPPPRVALTKSIPTNTTGPSSTVINDLHAAEIASWIDEKVDPYSVMNNPYEYKLLIRGTRDGFTANSFWNLCDKQENVVVVMKVKGTDEILGGYNPIGWDKSFNGYESCDKSFIFSLKNGTIKSSILSRVIEPENAICNLYSWSWGPGFGGGCDLYMSNKSNQDNDCWCYQQSYEKRIRDASTYNNEGGSYFSIEEYEIFQISKKF